MSIMMIILPCLSCRITGRPLLADFTGKWRLGEQLLNKFYGLFVC
jgi:hypothetical protein